MTYPTPTAARSRIDSSGAGSSSLAASPHSCCCGSSCPPSKPWVQSPRNKCFSPEERSQAVRELCNRRGTARKVAQSIGVSVPVLYKWKKDLISDEAYQSMRKRKSAPQDKNQDALLGEIQRLRKQVHQLQLERDILTKANELIKKRSGRQLSETENREKTLIVDALKKKYPVAELLSVLQLARSCYFYQNVCTISMRKYA